MKICTISYDYVRYTFYNIETDTWTPVQQITSNNFMEYGPTMVKFTKSGKASVMMVYNSDMDGDMYLFLSIKFFLFLPPSFPPPSLFLSSLF